MRFPIVVSIVASIVVALVARRRPVAYRPQGSIPGKAVIPVAYIPRRFHQLISSAPTDRYSILAARREAAGGVAILGSVIVSPHRLALRPRLAPRVARAGRRTSRSRRPARLAAPFPRSRSGARRRHLLGPAVITASK